MESRTLDLLEFHKVLSALADFCASEAGSDFCRTIRPLDTREAILDQNALYREGSDWVAETGFKLRPFPDLAGLFNFLESQSAVLDQDALTALVAVMLQAKDAKASIDSAEEGRFSKLPGLLGGRKWPQQAMSGISRCLDDKGRLRDESSPDLLAVRSEIRSIHQRCTKKVKEFLLREELTHALQDEYMTISSDRYVLPLKANFKNRIKGIIHDYSQTGETCYFEPMFLVETNNRLQELKQEERAEELKVLKYLTGLVRAEYEGVAGVYEFLLDLDVLLAKISFANRLDGRIVDVTEGGAPSLKRVRHPLLALADVKVQPIDLVLEEGQRALIISGGNAGGKTVCLKTLGLSALLAFASIPIPVDGGGTLPFWEEILVVMGDEQSLEEHVSTFTAQIQYINRVWDKVGPNTLFILDEFGAGTDPTQGAALAQAVIDSLMEHKTTAVAATHFPALKAYAMATKGARAASVLFDPGTKRPLYRLAYDQVGASIALDVAREHGLPDEILGRAEKYLLLDGSDTTTVLDRLNALAVDREQELDKVREERDKLKVKRDKLEKRYERESKALLDEIQAEAQNVVREWKQEKIGRKQAQKKLANAREKLAKTAPKQPEEKSPAISMEQLKPGANVVYRAWGKAGKVLEVDLRKKQAKVDVNGVAMWAKFEHLEKGQRQSAKGSASAAVSSGATPESRPAMALDLRGRRTDEALSELERFIDGELRRGADSIEIIHGRGTGALRREVHEFLSWYPSVKRFSLATEENGGDGMTQVELK